MPSRVTVAKELAEIFKVVAHPDRIRLIEELRSGDKDVSALAVKTNLSPTRVSQHLALLRSHRLVEEARVGRRHFYRLIQPQIAQWIVDGIAFIEGSKPATLAEDVARARELWS